MTNFYNENLHSYSKLSLYADDNSYLYGKTVKQVQKNYGSGCSRPIIQAGAVSKIWAESKKKKIGQVLMNSVSVIKFYEFIDLKNTINLSFFSMELARFPPPPPCFKILLFLLSSLFCPEFLPFIFLGGGGGHTFFGLAVVRKKDSCAPRRS